MFYWINETFSDNCVILNYFYKTKDLSFLKFYVYILEYHSLLLFLIIEHLFQLKKGMI